MPYWRQMVPQISISNRVRQDLLWWKKNQYNLVIGSTLHPPKHHHLLHTDSSMKGLRSHTYNLKVSVLWTPSQVQNHRKTTTASVSPSSGPLEFGSNGSETVSFRLNQTTPQQWLTNIMMYRNISPLTKTLLMSAREYNIIVHMRFIPGSMNAIMDTLSRKNKLVPT